MVQNTDNIKEFIMTIIEHDFVNFLIEIGYTKNSAHWYKGKLTKFAKETGYKSLVDLADDVFVLLNYYNQRNIKFDDELVSKIHKYKNILVLFNSFLFDICYPRTLFIYRSHTTTDTVMFSLSTLKPYSPGLEPRQLVDFDKINKRYTDQKYFNMAEVEDALHVKERTLTRWAQKDENGDLKEHEPHRYIGIPPEIKENEAELNKYNLTLFNNYYYKLDELNEFLRYQFRHGTPKHKKKHMAETYTTKYTKKQK